MFERNTLIKKNEFTLNPESENVSYTTLHMQRYSHHKNYNPQSMQRTVLRSYVYTQKWIINARRSNLSKSNDTRYKKVELYMLLVVDWFTKTF